MSKTKPIPGGPMLKPKDLNQLLRDFASGRMNTIDPKLRKQLESQLKLINPYKSKGYLDPNGIENDASGDVIDCKPISILACTERKPVDGIFMLDIESLGMRPDILHLACIYDPKTDTYWTFRTWHDRHKKTKKKAKNGRWVQKVENLENGVIEWAEDRLMQHLEDKERGFNYRVYAHKGSHFDWVGLAYSLFSNCSLDHRWEDDQSGVVFDAEGNLLLDKNEMLRLDPSIRKYLRKGLWFNAEKLVRIRKVKGPKGRMRSVKFTWTLEKAGHRAYLKVKMGRHVISLVDSYWHLPVPLRDLGSKGETPLQYTDHMAWLRNEAEEGRLKKGQDPLAYWFNHLDESAVEYCKQDCKILADALQRYRDLYGSLFTREDGTAIDPLAYLTSSQSGLAGMISRSNPPEPIRKKNPKNQAAEGENDPDGNPSVGGVIVHRPGVGWILDSNPDSVTEVMTDEKTEVRRRPIAKYGEQVVVPRGWFMWEKYQKPWKNVQFGGRTEVFQPMNRKGTRVFCIDANSLYPSVMFDQSLSYFDPRFIRPLKEEISGKKQILKFLGKYGGMFKVRSTPATNPVIRDLPIFPLRLSGDDFDSRLVFGNWEGEMVFYATSEELKYFLENTDVENDDILVFAEDSYYSHLMSAADAPFHPFAGRVYGERRRAREAGNLTDAAILKLIMNSGGFGVLVQTNDKPYYMQEGNQALNEQAMAKMIALAPDWEGWDNYKSGAWDEFKTAMAWCRDHYRPWHVISSHKAGRGVARQIKVNLPSSLADHAIRSFGCSITAHGRITLHKAMLAARRAEIRKEDTQTSIREMNVLYCDTDSLYIEVPEDMGDDLVVQRLQESKIIIDGKLKPAISIGPGLGQWKVEQPVANPKLITDKADLIEVDGEKVINKAQGFFFAPKHYYLTDRPDENGYRNVLKDVIKGVPSWSSLMRTTMYAFYVQASKLGDPRGLEMENPLSKDLMKNLMKGKGVKRIYGAPDKQSKPVVIREPIIPEGMEITYLDYMQAVGKSAKGKAQGIREALNTYQYYCLINGQPFLEMRERCETAHSKLRENIIMNPDAALGNNYNKAMEFLSKHTKVIDAGADPIRDDLPI